MALSRAWDTGRLGRVTLSLLILVLMGALFVACADDDKVRVHFLGTVDGTQAFIAIDAGDLAVHEGDRKTPLSLDGRRPRFVAYVCDDGTIAEWFVGPTAQRELDLRSSSGARLKATLEEDMATGTVTLDGRDHPFTATLGGEGGAYREEDSVGGQKRLTGWIMLPDGRVRGASLVGGTVQQAPPLRTNRQITPF